AGDPAAVHPDRQRLPDRLPPGGVEPGLGARGRRLPASPGRDRLTGPFPAVRRRATPSRSTEVMARLHPWVRRAIVVVATAAAVPDQPAVVLSRGAPTASRPPTAARGSACGSAGRGR